MMMMMMKYHVERPALQWVNNHKKMFKNIGSDAV